MEFTDFQCPFCAAAADRLSELLDEFPDDLAISVRHFPLGIHDQAQVASIAAECAAEQGHFRQMHDVLFDKQPDIGGTAWREFARMAEVPNIERFQDCIEQPSVADRVKADARLGTEIGVSATPSFIIDGRLHKTGLDAVQSIADAVRKR